MSGTTENMVNNAIASAEAKLAAERHAQQLRNTVAEYTDEVTALASQASDYVTSFFGTLFRSN